MWGSFHYGNLTGQRPVRIPKENGTTFSNQTGPTKRKALTIFYPIFYLFSEPYIIHEKVGQ